MRRAVSGGRFRVLPVISRRTEQAFAGGLGAGHSEARIEVSPRMVAGSAIQSFRIKTIREECDADDVLADGVFS